MLILQLASFKCESVQLRDLDTKFGHFVLLGKFTS